MREAGTYQVDRLLMLARFPERFYPLVYNLSGNDMLYKNPGVSVRSFVIARAIRYETVEIENEILAAVKECEKFSSDPKVISQIYKSLNESTVWLVTEINGLPNQVRVELINEVTELHTAAQAVKISFEALFSIQPEESSTVDLTTPPGQMFKQSLYLLQDKIERITDLLSEKRSPEPVLA